MNADFTIVSKIDKNILLKLVTRIEIGLNNKSLENQVETK